MSIEITVHVDASSSTAHESAVVELEIAGKSERVRLDVDVSALLAGTRVVPDLGQDFLFIAAIIYAADKAVSRQTGEDQWTRDIGLTIPSEHADTWNKVADDFAGCVGFLTGDKWQFRFTPGNPRLIRKKKKRATKKISPPDVAAVSLFSGGLDSYIGAVDWLTNHPDERLLLVGHYDRDVAGPGKDQRDLVAILKERFGSRFDFVQSRVGIVSGGEDINFRSRSLLFLAMATYFADTIGRPTPVLIPENGPIALNFPLTPSRRGSCSTRTVHPAFLHGLNSVLRRVGLCNAVANPYELLTKGEMTLKCADQAVLLKGCSTTRSCAKANRRMWWANRTARGCGVCVPCLFRRAALHAAGHDTEVYGNRIEDIHALEKTPDDVLAMGSFLRRDLDRLEITRGLLANGSIPVGRLPEYAGVIERMRAEVAAWMKAKGSKFVKGLAAI